MNRTRISWVRNQDGTQGYTWNPVLDFPGYYVSEDGRIISFLRRNPHILTPIRSRTGHLYIFLYRRGQMTKVWIHRAVLMAFKRPPSEGEECRHLNGDPKDNRIFNLKWGSKQDNADDRRLHGTIPIGESAGTHKLTEQDVLYIRKNYKNKTLRAWAAEYGVSHTCIRRAALGIKWSYLKEATA